MKNFKIIIILSFFSINIFSQSVNSPESIVFDAMNNVYIISNTGNGTIIKLDEYGVYHDFVSGLFQPRGLFIADGKLYVAQGNIFSGFDLNSGSNVINIEIPAATFLNDICMANGYFFVSATLNGKIYKINIVNHTYSVFVETNLDYPNGLYFDAVGNRIIVASFSSAPIQAVSLSDSSVSNLIIPSENYLDGIAVDHKGDYYISAWGNSYGTADGKILKYDPNFTQETVFANGFSGPADISFSIEKMEIAIPNMIGNNILFEDLCNVQTGEIIGDTIVYENAISTYYVENTANSTYSWDITGGAIESGMSSNSIEVSWGTVGIGKLSVKETDQYNCEGQTVQINVTIKSPEYVEIINPYKLYIYPNPAKEFFSINYSLTKTKNIDISILNKNGNFISSLSAGKQNIGEYNLRFNCKNIGISSGIYFIKFLIDDEISIKKIVIIE